MVELHLTPAQEAEAQVLFQRLKAAFEREALPLARLLASKEARQLLGGTEFAVREQVHQLGAQVLETALQARKKGGIRGRVLPVFPARRRPAALATAARPW